jgi:hypothetical protein
LKNLPAIKKAARSGGCSDVLLQFLKSQHDPPAASELRCVKFQKRRLATVIMAGSIARRSRLVIPNPAAARQASPALPQMESVRNATHTASGRCTRTATRRANQLRVSGPSGPFRPVEYLTASCTEKPIFASGFNANARFKSLGAK